MKKVFLMVFGVAFGAVGLVSSVFALAAGSFPVVEEVVKEVPDTPVLSKDCLQVALDENMIDSTSQSEVSSAAHRGKMVTALILNNSFDSEMGEVWYRCLLNEDNHIQLEKVDSK